MCGRYSVGLEGEELAEAFGATLTFEHHPRYNVAPGQDAPVLVVDPRRGRLLGLLRWGLVPWWAEDPRIGNRLINARSESVAEKPAFREAFHQRRCLVPADGFYEWARESGRKVPYWVHRRGGGLFAFAGLRDRWRPPEGEPLHTFAILTTAAAPGLRRIHPRMPVLLAGAAAEAWLDPDSEAGDLLPLLRPFPDAELEAWPVSTRVNTPENDDPGCIEPVAAEPFPED